MKIVFYGIAIVIGFVLLYELAKRGKLGSTIQTQFTLFKSPWQGPPAPSGACYSCTPAAAATCSGIYNQTYGCQQTKG